MSSNTPCFRGWRLVASIAVLALLVGLGAERAWSWQQIREERTQGEVAVRAASHQVAALISISQGTVDAEIDRLLAGATGDFRSELGDRADELRAAMAKEKVDAEGAVDSAALEEINGAKATVLVAASGTVKNASIATPEPRRYRFRVDLVREKDDHWLVSGMEFVQ